MICLGQFFFLPLDQFFLEGLAAFQFQQFLAHFRPPDLDLLQHGLIPLFFGPQGCFFVEAGNHFSFGLFNPMVQQHHMLVVPPQAFFSLRKPYAALPGFFAYAFPVALIRSHLAFLFLAFRGDGTDPGADMVCVHLFRVNLFV